MVRGSLQPDLPPNPDLPTSGGMCAQTTLEEAREAQRLADAGDPRYTWQVDSEIFDRAIEDRGAELFTRFLREELGWDAFRWGVGGEPYPDDRPWEVIVVRCAPARTNPLYPNDPARGVRADDRRVPVRDGEDQRRPARAPHSR